MPLDALCLTAVAAELRAAVAGGKIDKLYQPTRDEVVLYVRGQGENVRLLLSANPGHPRANLTTLNRENPEQPPMFCMLLRKHLQGARILELNQPPLERILEFRLETLDELGDRVELGPPPGAGGHGPQRQPPAAGRGGAYHRLHPPGGRRPWPGSAAASARPVLPPTAGT